MSVKTQNQKRVQCNFRPSEQNLKYLEVAKRNGIDVSELINEVLEENLVDALHHKAKDLTYELKMVRGAGFEPATPTVSR